MKCRFHYGLFSTICIALFMFSPAGAQQSVDMRDTITSRVFFDHLYIVVDEETYKAISESDFIRDVFCIYTEDTVSNEDESWTGAYLNGDNAYIEVFGPGGFNGAEEGAIGLGFISTRIGDIDIVCERYREHFGEGIEAKLTHFVTDTLKFPWFYTLSSDSSEENPVSTWVMEYHPMHLQSMGVTPDSTGTILREDFMKALNGIIAGEEKSPTEPMMFKDITAISLKTTQSELDRLSMELDAISYTKKIENEVTSFYGPGITINCTITSNPRYRLQSLSINLSHNPKRRWLCESDPIPY